jgi:NifU-like protein involved in Fe-S cluster formation
VRAFKARHASTMLTFDAVVDAIERAGRQGSQAAE